MFELKKILHTIVIAVTSAFAKLMPDRTPVTLAGPGSSEELCGSIAQMGFKKVLIVTDAMLVKLGMVETISKKLTDRGVEVSIYDGVEPDPTFDQVHAGLEQLRREGCDAILAVGGGSPMDASKAIAAGATSRKPLEKLEGMMKVRQAPLALFAIPTTAGTGSEVTIVAVVSDAATHQKKFFIDPKLLPMMAALDPSLMTGLPKPVTAATGMDALTHAVESFLCSTSTEQTERWALGAVRMIFENLPKAYSEGSDLEARNAMALASYYAGMAFTRTGVGYVHAIAHAFGAHYRTPHGLANAIVLPHILEYSTEPARARLARLADAIGIERAGDQAKADAFVQAVRDLMAKVEIPYTLESLKRTDIPAIAEQAVGEAHMNYPVPRYMSQQDCEALLQRMAA
jgi:alcohol dehydrogenase class IV